MKSSNDLKHVAIIMDGNGRWAKRRGLPRIEGHRRGAEAVKRTLRAAQASGIQHLTLYAFSVENWNRPKDEVDALMDLLLRFVDSQLPEMIKHRVRFRAIGRSEELTEDVCSALRSAESQTKHFGDFTLDIAINYGSRTEIVDATKRIASAVQSSELSIDAIDYTTVERHLYTADAPDPDLVIRTSGESRLSNFLLLQSAYSEFFVSEVLWPDFDEAAFQEAISSYQLRERRYGKTTEQLA